MNIRENVFRTGNPALKAEVFDITAPTGEDTMTLQGTVWKTWFLLFLVGGVGAWSWSRPELFMPYWMGWCLASFVLGLLTIYFKTWSPVLAPVYAVLQGCLLGAVSMVFERRFPGIVVQAVTLTLGTLAALLFAYQSRLIRVTENLKLGIVAATGAVALTYIIDLGLHFFGKSIPVIHQSSIWGILFSAVVVVIAAFNLVLDFDFIETGADRGAPKYMEWYGAFGLIVTLVWLYLEILRLLSKTRSRRD